MSEHAVAEASSGSENCSLINSLFPRRPRRAAPDYGLCAHSSYLQITEISPKNQRPGKRPRPNEQGTNRTPPCRVSARHTPTHTPRARHSYRTMPSETRQWPAWAEYAAQGAAEAKDPEFLAIKKAIISEYGAEALRESWIKTCRALADVTDEIALKGESMIPIVDTAEVLKNGFTDAQLEEAKRVGAFVCRETVPRDEASKLYQDLRTFVDDNKGSIRAWPVESPSMLILYNSPTQTALRTHPNQLKLQRLLNGLWSDSSNETSPDPLIYLDGVRDRGPGQPFLGLGPHIDAGSLCRWADPTYRHAYESIFSGRPEQHDPYDLGLRKDAQQDLYKGAAHSTVLRSFQGWTALTPTAPREGTIMVYPNLKVAIAYVLLRPFFAPPADEADIMDAEKWTLDETTGNFPGTFKPDSQRLSRSSHPHLRLEECLVHMPKIYPGDTVWWHCDVSEDTAPPLGSHSADAFNHLGLPRRRHGAPGGGKRFGGLHRCLPHHARQQGVRKEATPGYLTGSRHGGLLWWRYDG